MRNQKFFRNISSKTQEKEAPQENILDFFLLNTLKTIFEWKIELKDEHNQVFLSKVRALFLLFKKGRGDLPSSP